MIKFYKELVAGVEHAGIYQSIALVLFVLFFTSVLIKVISKPKNYYNEQSNMPLDLDDNNNNNNIK